MSAVAETPRFCHTNFVSMCSPEGQSNRDARLDRIDAYDFALPPELIAHRPLPERDASRLLVIDRQSGSWEHRRFRDLPDYFSAGDVAVFNSTKVLPAKLQGVREATGGKWNGLFIGLEPDGRWRLIGRTRGKLNAGETILLTSFASDFTYKLVLSEKTDDGWLADPEDDQRAEVVLGRVGTMPLPPYIEREGHDPADVDRYQTVFARDVGAIAAPTAGLHFTPEILEQLDHRGVVRADVTLHVGVGTFRPVTAERLDDHVMHHEWARIDQDAVDAIDAATGSVLAVGTTAVRTLETAAAAGQLEPFQGETNLFIRPPYKFRVVDRLLTNFHLPKSTLLVLVSAMAGRELILDAYNDAVREQYRFFSYGDAMLIL